MVIILMYLEWKSGGNGGGWNWNGKVDGYCEGIWVLS